MNVSVFGVGKTTSVGGSWKPVAVPSHGDSSEVVRAKAAGGDSVSVSPLGQSLKGVAADMFSLLDQKGKGMLEKLVSSGSMSAEEVALGLRAAATDGAFGRYAETRPRDVEDQAILATYTKAETAMRDHSQKLGAARADFNTSLTAAMSAIGRNEVDTAGFQAMMAEPQAGFDVALKQANDGAAGAPLMQDALAAGWKKAVEGFNTALKDQIGGDGMLEFASDVSAGKGADAKNKLIEAFKAMEGGGNGQETALGKAIQRFAASVDIPGVGRAGPSLAALTAEAGAPSAEPANAPVATAAVATATPPAIAAKPSVTTTAADRSKSALSMLQTALDANTKARASVASATTADKAEADLSSLMDALKSGTAASSPNVKIDT
ncbi:hypothetical protein D3877_18980 [Azospirillum cavernae]|uniref:Uncharacterized protein n=1 Tax=Azospirillum cavernae TaxID=2320860 RepID=A0A418VYD0_9PROT|nr:hypothetical protein [Azospirillum cavernae]RJF82146.1 hypothetical protein D3877_18980 [Azospirillum cavernae]